MSNRENAERIPADPARQDDALPLDKQTLLDLGIEATDATVRGGALSGTSAYAPCLSDSCVARKIP